MKKLTIIAVMAMGLLLSPISAFAQCMQSASTTMQEFVMNFYDWYLSSDRSYLDALSQKADCFEPTLRQMLLAASGKQECEAAHFLDFNPFLGSQDWDKPQVNVKVVSQQGKSALVELAITLFPNTAPQKITVELDKRDAWRIRNFLYPDLESRRGNLRSILRNFEKETIACKSPAKVTKDAAFGNSAHGAWAMTPKGRFECLRDESTGYLQTLSLDGKPIYQQTEYGPEPGGKTISLGIKDYGAGCPWILANRHGYVVIVRDTQVPDYGIQGYAIVNFNAASATLIELAEGQRPEDEKIPESGRLQWKKDHLELLYFGYPSGQVAGFVDSPKPKQRKARLIFSNQSITQDG